MEGVGESELQVAIVSTKTSHETAVSSDPLTDAEITSLLSAEPTTEAMTSFRSEQQKDPKLLSIVTFLETGKLPDDDHLARKVALQSPLFTMANGVLYMVDTKRKDQSRVAVPKHLRSNILDLHHRGPNGGHF